MLILSGKAMKHNRNINLKNKEIISICVDGSTELRLMLSDDNEWILVEELAVTRGIDRERAKKEIGKHFV